MRLVLLFSALALAACKPEPEMSDPLPVADECGASGYTGLVGSPIAAVTFPAGLNMRIIQPGDMVTMDHRPDRMNIELDENGVITRVYCG